MKSILIVGNTSMLGKRLIARLSGENRVVTAGRNEKADLFFDLEEGPQAVPDDFRCDVLVHCAASFEGDNLPGAIENERINSLGAFYVANLAKGTSCKHLIYISSISAYRHQENEYYGSYGISKSHGEDNLELSCRLLNICFTSMRLSQLYDEFGEARRHQPMLYDLIDKVSRGQDIVFYGTKDRVRNYIFIDDVVTVVEKIIDTGLTGAFPVIFPRSYTFTQIAEIAYEVFRTKGGISFLKDKPDIKSVYIPPLPDLYSHIGYVPETDLRSGLSLIRDNFDLNPGSPLL